MNPSIAAKAAEQRTATLIRQKRMHARRADMLGSDSFTVEFVGSNRVHYAIEPANIPQLSPTAILPGDWPDRAEGYQSFGAQMLRSLPGKVVWSPDTGWQD